jgi:hypothetical protein
MTDTNIQTANEDVTTNPPATETTETTVNPVAPDTETIDYKEKFSASSREAQRLLDEKKALEAELEIARNTKPDVATYSNDSDNLYPGFETLGEEEQKNLIAYTQSIEKKVRDSVYKDPAIAYAKSSYDERQWEGAFDKVASAHPELKDARDDFKAKYFRAGNVPPNIDSILGDLAKVYLFDKAKEIGAKEAIEQQSRIEIERASGGDKTPTASRTLEDWHQMAQGNPAKFAQLSKEYQSDLESGKLK